jgi:hypothetical protein
MVISAKFASTCPKCGQPIRMGTRIDWSKGCKAKHVECPSGESAAPAKHRKSASKSASEPTREAAPFVRYERWEPCTRAELRDTTGDVRIACPSDTWATVRDGATATSVTEGDAFVVVAQAARYQSQEENEDCGDMRGANWQVTLYLRRATDEEAAPARALAAEKRAKADAAAARKAMIAELTKLCQAGERVCDDAARLPEGIQVEIAPGVHGSGHTLAVLAAGGAVSIWCGGYYDDYRATLATTREPRAVEIMTALLA